MDVGNECSDLDILEAFDKIFLCCGILSNAAYKTENRLVERVGLDTF